MHTENSSNTNPPAKALAETILTVSPHFPNEMILAIVAHLEFDDLKSARLLSKAWCSCASTFLFTNLSVSPNKEDLEVFEAITQHPQLSKCVRHFWYNGSEFLLHLPKTWYLNQLWRQKSPLYASNQNQAGVKNLHSSDSEINSWVQDVVYNNMSLDVTMATFRKAKFVKDGYRKYHQHAIYQQKCLQDGTFVERLVQGLKQLGFLKAVTLEYNWDSDDKPFEPCKGSRLARSWSLFHCRPARWDWELHTYRGCPYKASNGAEHYHILVSALVQAQRRIRAFQTSSDSRCALTPYVFDRDRKTRSAKPLQFHNDNVTAFAGVEELGLRLGANGHTENPKLFQNIAGLSAVLGSMDHLKRLELRLPVLMYCMSTLYTYDQVFPTNVRWENLEVLKLFQLSIGATDFLLLLLDAMPGLRQLEMGVIILSQGCWEGVFEALKQMHRLRVLRIPDGEKLYQRGDREHSVDYFAHGGLCHQLTTYVMNGTRHPCLPAEQPDSAAREYTRDLDPVLRQRLIDLDGSSSQVEDTA